MSSFDYCVHRNRNKKASKIIDYDGVSLNKWSCTGAAQVPHADSLPKLICKDLQAQQKRSLPLAEL
jgi:hypothetical protein